MFDVAKDNLWLLLMLQELQEKEHKCSLRKEILQTLRNLRKMGKDEWPRRLCHIEIEESEDRIEEERDRGEDTRRTDFGQ